MKLPSVFHGLSLIIVTVSASNLNLTARPSATVMIGGQVTLRCSVETGGERSLKTNWMHNSKMVGENCEPFDAIYKTKCPPGDPKNPPYYDFVIKPVRWEDRGNWSCYYGMNYSQVIIKVVVPPLMEKHTIRKSIQVKGDGSRNRPYDLTSGHTISMACSTSCGYPKSDLIWTFKNSSSNGKIGEPVTYFRTKNCSESKIGMYTRTSTFTSINCSKHKLIGFSEISCSLNNKEPFKYENGKTSSRTYILCPGGMQAPALTYGEMIAIAVGSAVALIVVFTNCFLLKERRRKATRNRALTISSH